MDWRSKLLTGGGGYERYADHDSAVDVLWDEFQLIVRTVHLLQVDLYPPARADISNTTDRQTFQPAALQAQRPVAVSARQRAAGQRLCSSQGVASV